MAQIDLDQISDVVVPGASDSRPCMKEIAKLLGLDAEATEEQIAEAIKALPGLDKVAKALELKDDATEQDVLDAIEAVKKDEVAEEISLEDKAKKEGKVVLEAKDAETLLADARAGREANDKLHQREFDDAYKKCLDEVRVDAKDETREEWQELYNAAPEATLKRLKGLPKLASTKPRGSGGGPGQGGEAPDGVDAERYELDLKVQARMRKDDCDYEEALDKVRAEEDEV